MASRLVEAGTVIARVHNLLRAGVLKERPLWLDVVEAFPPFQSAQHNRVPEPGRAPRINYPEHRERQKLSGERVWSLFDDEKELPTDRFVHERLSQAEKSGTAMQKEEAASEEALENTLQNLLRKLTHTKE